MTKSWLSIQLDMAKEWSSWLGDSIFIRITVAIAPELKYRLTPALMDISAVQLAKSFRSRHSPPPV